MTPSAPASRNRTVAAICATKVHAAAIAAGIDPRRLSAIDVDDGKADGFEVRLPYEALLTRWEEAIRAADDPGFPVFVAARAQPRDYDVLGFAYMTQANLREALHQTVRYHDLWSDAAKMTLTGDARTSTLTLDADAPERLGARCLTESLFAEMVHWGRLLTGTDFRPVEARFRHRAPRDTRAIEAFFKAPVRFNAPRSELVVDTERLATPLLKADPDLAAFFQRSVEDRLERRAADGLAARLRALLEGELGWTSLTLEAAAARLGVSARTLRRRLQEEGTTFQDICDETRCEIAKRHLGADKLALGEVAFLLGFSEPSAFHRAFKRWTGKTPLAYRRLGAA